ncbi:MAG: sulfotransferase domain-containing protein [Planctomycetota bacterium]
MGAELPILIAGLPKTGTTGLLAAVRASVGGEVVFEPDSFERVRRTSGCSLVKIVYPPHEARTLREVMDEYSSFPRRVWIVRDPRDQLVSMYLYTWFKGHRMPEARYRVALDLVRRKEAGESIPFSRMLLETFSSMDTYIHERDYHHRRLMSFFDKKGTESVHLFRYEDLVASSFESLSDYLGVGIEPAEVDKGLGRVVRTRGTGGWRAWFEPEDEAFFRPLFGPYMHATGCADDWDTTPETPDPVHGSRYMEWLWSGAKGSKPSAAGAV